MAGDAGCVTLEIFSRQAGIHPDYEVPKQASDGIHKLIAGLQIGDISPGQAAASPLLSAWAAEALAEQPRLRALLEAQAVLRRENAVSPSRPSRRV